MTRLGSKAGNSRFLSQLAQTGRVQDLDPRVLSPRGATGLGTLALAVLLLLTSSC